MNKQELIEFVNLKLQNIVLEINENKTNLDNSSAFIFFQGSLAGKNFVSIKKYENFRSLKEIINKLSSEKALSEKYSEKYISNIITHLLYDLIDLPASEIKDKITNLIDELLSTQPYNYTVISKLENLDISEDLEYKLLDSTIKVFHKNNESQISELAKFEEDRINNSPIIITNVSAAEYEKAQELALINYENTFNLIKLIFPHYDIKLEGTMYFGRRDLIVIKNDPKNAGISSNTNWIGDSKVNSARLNSPIYNKFKELNIENISATQQKYIKECLYWYGQGLKSEHPSSRLINYATIFESLLKLKDEKTELNKSIPERGALLLNNEFTIRLKIKNELKEIYNVRGDVVHKGVLINDKDISFIAGAYARQVILRYIELAQKYNTHEKLIEYLDNLKLGFVEETS